MPKKKHVGPCSVIGCGKPIDVKFMCQRHYIRMWKFGHTDPINTGKTHHPLYVAWFERKQRDSLCPAWVRFDAFLQGVGERPSPAHYLGRQREYENYGPDNFEWREHARAEPDETPTEKHARKWRAQKAKNPELDVGRHLLRDFGITPQRYVEMVEEQGGVCFICKAPETSKHGKSGKLRRLAVDHCHSSNVVRDLLCQRCNQVIGHMREDRALAHAMADYFDRWEDPEGKAAELGRPPRMKAPGREIIIQTPWGPLNAREAAARVGLDPGTVLSRINRGWPEEKLLIPLRRPSRRRPQLPPSPH